ncbi:MAG: WhiB family transcriptional regulator, redox-sensing transcriptional regulator [Actinomycetota bacterium]|jgi:WhiB family redox-sensing transcriptional regulator|nr:WhiB family transcriptional regulator, redox-sensing transcriptional regulator [Actinomycetota bacterium]
MLAQWLEIPAEDKEQFRWSDARCRDGEGSLTDLFFSEQLDDIAHAKAICGECALIEPCLDGAQARREPWGVWGGQLFANGKILAFKRKRGRPPKNAQAQLTA